VLAIYAKSVGKAGKHCQVSDSSNITAVSNLPIQLFDHFIGVQFQAIPAGQTLHVKMFSLVPSLVFLCTLASAPAILENRLKISQQDGILFRTLKEGCTNIIKAVTSLAGHRKKALPLDNKEELED
ncbi:hypothetical protein L208DRAFT_1271846, partial [Tricholoma matsutake]